MEEEHKETSFIFEIDNFSERMAPISSPIFTSGRCKWFVKVFPKRYNNRDYVFMYLDVANTKSLRPGWKRKAYYSFVMLNESGKELQRISAFNSFCAEVLAWYYPKMFDEEVCLENNKLIIKVEIKVSEVVHYGDETSTEMLYLNGFQISQTQVSSVQRIFKKHPKLALAFKPKNRLVKTAYMNVLLGLIETLKKHPLSLSLTEISKADSDLTELTEAGFKLDWLKSKLDKLSLKLKKLYDIDGSEVQQLEGCVKNLELMELDFKLKKITPDDVVGDRVQKLEERVNSLELMNTFPKLDSIKTIIEDTSLWKEFDDRSRVQELEERVKNLELKETDYKLDCLKSKLAEVTLEKKTSDDANRSRVQELEERIKNLELKETDYKLNCLKSKLAELTFEKRTLDDADRSRVQELEERLKNLELKETGYKLDCLNSKLAEVTLEKKTSDDANRSRVQELEERIKNLELKETDYTLNCLKSKLAELTFEKRTLDDADRSRVQELEERLKNLELKETDYKLDCLKSKLAEVTLEKKTSDDANRSGVQELKERIKNLELIVGDLKVELDNKKPKSCDDGFLLVN